MERVLNTIISPRLKKQALRAGKRDKTRTEERSRENESKHGGGKERQTRKQEKNRFMKTT